MKVKAADSELFKKLLLVILTSAQVPPESNIHFVLDAIWI